MKIKGHKGTILAIEYRGYLKKARQILKFFFIGVATGVAIILIKIAIKYLL